MFLDYLDEENKYNEKNISMLEQIDINNISEKLTVEIDKARIETSKNKFEEKLDFNSEIKMIENKEKEQFEFNYDAILPEIEFIEKSEFKIETIENNEDDNIIIENERIEEINEIVEIPSDEKIKDKDNKNDKNIKKEKKSRKKEEKIKDDTLSKFKVRLDEIREEIENDQISFKEAFKYFQKNKSKANFFYDLLKLAKLGEIVLDQRKIKNFSEIVIKL